MTLPEFNASHWIIQTVAMMITVFFIPRLRVNGPLPALATVIVLAFINAHLWSTALFFSIPSSLTLQTVLLLLVNGIIFWIVVKVLPGIEVDGIFPAIVAPLVFTVLSIVIEAYAPSIDWRGLWQEAVSWMNFLRGYFQTAETLKGAQLLPHLAH